MHNPVDPSRISADDEPDGRFESALREAFGPATTAAAGGRRGVLEVLRESTGVTSRVLLHDEPDAPSPVVGPGEGSPLAGGPTRYQVQGEIARGGMGVVLKAHDPDLGRDVAIKVLHPSHSNDHALVRRFIEEAQIGGQLQHPGILPVYELGLDAEFRPYFTMRLLKGRSLAALLEERTDPGRDLGRFLSVFEQACQAVSYAHARGVIHRDLKPANIMVGAFGEVEVIDWGLSKVLLQGDADNAVARGGTARDEPQVTTIRTTGEEGGSASGAIIGTPPYMSPEQARGEIEGLDEQTDVFALGAILCEMLTGQPPYRGSRARVLEDAAAGRLDEALTRLDSCGADGALIQLARRCLDLSRAVRPRHAGVVARELASFLASVAERARAAEVAAAEARATATAERKARRRTTLLASVLVLAIAVGVWFAGAAQSERRARAERSISDVAALYRKVDWFRDKSRQIPPELLDTWGQALAQVRRTTEVIGSGAIDEETRRSVARLLDELKEEEHSLSERSRELRTRRRSR